MSVAQSPTQFFIAEPTCNQPHPPFRGGHKNVDLSRSVHPQFLQETPMHVIIIRLFLAALYICLMLVFFGIGGCAPPDTRNMWREMQKAGDL